MTEPALFTPPFVRLIVAHLLHALGYTSMLLLPVYLDATGATREDVGWVMAAAAISGLLFRPLVGWALDTIGRRPVLIIGNLITALGMLGILTIEGADGFAWAARFVFGIGEGICFSAFFTFAADLIPVQRRTEGLALFGVAGLLPLAFNPLVKSLGITTELIPAYIAALSASLIASALLISTVPDSDPAGANPTNEREGSRTKPTIGALFRPRLWPVWMVTVPFAGLVAAFMAFATVAAESRGIENPDTIWGLYAAGAIGVRLVGARLPDRVGPHNLIAPAIGVYAAAALILAGADDANSLLLAGGLAGLGHGYAFPVLSSQVVSRAPDALRGSALSMFTGIWDVCFLALPPLLGAFADRFDDRSMFALTALGATCGLIAWALAEGLTGRHKPNGPPKNAPSVAT